MAVKHKRKEELVLWRKSKGKKERKKERKQQKGANMAGKIKRVKVAEKMKTMEMNKKRNRLSKIRIKKKDK